MSRRQRLGSILVFALSARSAFGIDVEDVRLVGLFKDSAVVQIQDKRHILKVGKAGFEDVKLVATTRDSATLLIAGEQHQVSLSRALSRYAKQEVRKHIISINRYGQYFTAGSVNGRPVRFLVDTGATTVAMNTLQARRLGIDFAAGQPTQVSTAGGVVKAYVVTLERVKVGEIEVRNVRASVLEGVYPTQVLLGMTYLQHVRMSENNGVMTLTGNY